MFHWVELRTFCHATEERERVEHALRFASGGGEIQASPTEGQHGNPILILVTRLEDRKAIAAFWDRATSKEHALAWRKNLEDRVDHGVTFHVRFDKQAAYQERLALAVNEDIIDTAVKVRVYPARRESAIVLLREELDRRCS